MYAKILCPVDGSDVSRRGMQEALRLAQNQGAAVKFIYILDLGPLTQYPLGEEAMTSLRQSGRDVVDAALAAAAARGVHAEGEVLEIVQGRVGPSIIAEAERSAPDLIVMGTHGRRGLTRLLLGSDAAAVLSAAKVPVLMVK